MPGPEWLGGLYLQVMMTLELRTGGLLAQPSLMVLQSPLTGLQGSLIVRLNSGLSSLFPLVGWPSCFLSFFNWENWLECQVPKNPMCCLFCWFWRRSKDKNVIRTQCSGGSSRGSLLLASPILPFCSSQEAQCGVDMSSVVTGHHDSGICSLICLRSGIF